METKTKVLLDNIRDVFLTLQAQEHAVSQETRAYDICPLIEEAVSKLSVLAKARNVELIHKNHCEKAVVRVDKRLFLVALTHLIENAMTYTMTPSIVNVALVKNSRVIRILVQDRGIGVSQADAPKLFQPFARGARAAEFDGSGIGVGLTLSRLLVKEWRGRIAWRNRPRGMGAEFELILPLASNKLS